MICGDVKRTHFLHLFFTLQDEFIKHPDSFSCDALLRHVA